MSDTPETDAAKFTTYSTRHNKYIQAVLVDFARAQERRIANLEYRLPDHLDGISCRDATIRLLEQRIEKLLKGEFICQHCGLRKNGEVDVKPEF